MADKLGCPFCQAQLSREEIEMWGSFTCPSCHKLVRVRRNYTARILRLGLTIPVLFLLLAKLSAWFRLHLRLSLGLSAGAAGALDEYLMRFMPIEIEPAMPGSIVGR